MWKLLDHNRFKSLFHLVATGNHNDALTISTGYGHKCEFMNSASKHENTNPVNAVLDN